MSEISIYDIVPTPKLADKLIGTSVGGVIEDVTYNFTLQELLQLFIPNLPANNLQGVLDYGNTATQNINLTGTITTTNLSVLATANILNSNLSGNTRVMAGLFDRTNASGTAGQFLRSTGTQVEWFTIPTVIPTLQQVLQSGNTSNISIVLTANITAVTATADTVISNTSLNVNGVLRDGIAAVGASNQILSSTGSGVRWVDMPVYNVVSPLLYDTPTKTFSIQVASSSQSGYLSSADWINFDGKQDAIILTTSGTSGAATFVANTLNIPVYSPDLSGYVPTSRTLTINGVSYDLSANRSWTIAAGVASVTATAPLSSSGGANPDISISQSDSSTDGYLSSVDWIDFNSKQDGLNGTGLVKSTAGVITYITDNSTNWNTAYNDSIVSAAVTGTATKTLTLNQQDGGTIQASWSDIDTGLTSVGVSMPSAFSVANSPLTSNGTIAITGAGTSLQYVDGTGALQTFPGLTGFVPYTGATTNVDLGVYSLTASALIKSGGTSSQFLKADGTVDSTSYQPFITAGTTSQYYRGDKTFQTLDTTVVPEGTNLYYLDSRARAALSFAAGSGAYNSTTGVITIPTNTNQLTNGASFITLSSLSAASPLSYNNLTGAFSISQSGASTDGYLSSTDWTTFNAKQVAGNYIVSLTGEATAVGPGAAAVTLNNASVTGKVLTGVNITGGTVLATDTMLTAFGKLQNQINGLIGSTIYQGVWDASTNTPTLTSSVGTNGFYYIVNVAGSTNLNGITDWKIGDWAIFNGGVWQKVDNTESVTSVNGFTGAVSLTTDNVAQGTTNLYFANSLARAAISLTVTGASGASTYNNTTGVLNVPTYTLSGLGGQPLATNLTSLSGLTFASTSFVKMTAAGTFALDTNTYALSSALANYLPLAGGTLTGALGGTTASFSGAVSTNAPSGGATGEGLVVGQSFKIDGSGTSQRAVMYVVSNVLSDTYGSGLQIQGANLADDKGFGFNLNTTGGFEIYVKNTSYNKALTIANTNAATFADTVTATSLIKTGGTSAQFLKADGSVDSTTYGTGTVTSVAALTIGTTGTDLSSTVATGTTTPAITLNVPTASAANRGALSAADWTTFNSKQSTITLTTTGSSGASTFTSNTLNVPTYTLSGLGGQPLATNLTSLAGLTFASASFVKMTAAGTFALDTTVYGTGTVTSVAALTIGTTGTDLSSTVATGTTTPVITLNVPTASAANRGALSAADWTTFNNKASTAALANYLPLAGGTLTGALGGTTATFTHSSGETLTLSKGSGPSIQFNKSAATVQNWALAGEGAAFKLYDYTASTVPFQIATTTGAATFAGALSGTSATFSGQLHIPNNSTGTLGGLYFDYNANAASRTWQIVSDYDAYGDFQIRQSTTQTGSTYSKILGFSPTGAATFSSSVSVNSTLSAYLGTISAGNAPASSGTTPVNPMLNLTNNRGIGMYFGGKYSGDYAQWIQVSDTGNLGVNYPLLLQPNGGNVGIGTTSPNALLHVNSGTTATQTIANFAAANYSSASSRTYIQIGTQYGDGSSRIGSINTTGNQSALVFQTHAATSDVWNDAMYINGSGSVGIGTTSPASLLDVVASTAYDGVIRVRSTSTNTPIVAMGVDAVASPDGYVGTQNNVPFGIRVNDVNRIWITTGGNVGIGTTTPTTYSLAGRHLELNDAGGGYSFFHNCTTTVKSFYAINESALLAALFTFSNHPLTLGTNNTERMRITGGGNVLIGTTTDAGYKLDVNGTVRTSGDIFTTSTLKMSGSSSYNWMIQNYNDANWGFGMFASGVLYYPTVYFAAATGDGDNRGFRVRNVSTSVNVLLVNSVGNATFSGSVSATSFFEVSDKTQKTLIQDNVLIKGIEKVTAKTYIKNNKEEIGYFAQDLQGVLDSSINVGEKGLLSLSYTQVHTAKIAVAESEIDKLKKRVAELEQQLNLN